MEGWSGKRGEIVQNSSNHNLLPHTQNIAASDL
jgi:hypothetical protein